MSKFIIEIDPVTGEKYIQVTFKGRMLVEHPIYNKGSAFTEQEREQLELYGVLPEHNLTMEQQVDKVYENYKKEPTPIKKYIYPRFLLNM